MGKLGTVLVWLGDEPTARQIQQTLSLSGYRVYFCTDKPGFQKAAREDPPDLVILGENLAAMEGHGPVRDILQKLPTAPILLLAEEEKESTYKSAMQAGFSDVICTPLKSSDLITCVEKNIEKARERKEALLIEARRKTRSLQRRVDELENLLTNLQDGVIVLDNETRVILINQAARTLLKIPADTVPGILFEQVTNHPELLSLIEKGKFPAAGFEITIEDATALSIALTPVPGLGMAILLHDITSLKKIDQIKSDIVSNVSHDLRSPLTAILGYVDLVERAGPVNDIQKEFISRARASVHNITSLIEDQLNLGRIESGLGSQKEVLSVNLIIQSSLDGQSLKIKEKNLILKFETGEENIPVLANPVLIRQVMDNLVGNAVKYTPDHGVIGVTTSIGNDQVLITVADSGIGIPAGDLPFIFDKYYRASNVESSHVGTGLGLSIVRSVVESHQGRIWVDSKVGIGTKFTILLPLAKEKN